MYLVLYIIFIFSLSSISPGDISKSIQFNGIDKIIHFFEYLILGILFSRSNYKNKIIYTILIFLVPYIDEYIIQFYSGRNVDFYDLLFNLLGLSTAFIINKLRK